MRYNFFVLLWGSGHRVVLNSNSAASELFWSQSGASLFESLFTMELFFTHAYHLCTALHINKTIKSPITIILKNVWPDTCFSICLLWYLIKCVVKLVAGNETHGMAQSSPTGPLKVACS